MSEATHLERISTLVHRADSLHENYYKENDEIKREIAEAVEAAKKDDVSVATIANYVGKSRQAINKVLTDVFGVRHPDKSENAKGNKHG